MKKIVRQGKVFEIQDAQSIFYYNPKNGKVKLAAVREHILPDKSKAYILDEEKHLYYFPSNSIDEAMVTAKEIIIKASKEDNWLQKILKKLEYYFYYSIIRIKFALTLSKKNNHEKKS